MPMELTVVCLSYRGYWRSKGRPSERGLRLDAEAGVRWILEHHQKRAQDGNLASTPVLLVWGQSIGSGVATNLAATCKLPLLIDGMLLETPFLSLREMLKVLYPQRWLPYKYLWPFLRNHLDSWANLGLIAKASKEDNRAPPNIYILEADRDELVPKEHGDLLYQRCRDVGIPARKGSAPVAYHNEAISRGEGKKLAAEAIFNLTKQALDRRGRE